MSNITVDTPLFIRLLEFAREDAKGDLALHVVSENADRLMLDKECLTMEDYWDLVKGANSIKEEVSPRRPNIATIIKRNPRPESFLG